ncbi:hypothetical protein HYV79_01500 [Candidatus Woesearchaeota archaeon]|nr:hypothetical protein [Candidatus Woesearchaeota archaeon]
MNPILLAAILGFLGGLVRSLVGLSKAMAQKKKIMPAYWTATIITSSIIGIFTGIIFDFDHRLSLLAGYAGTDLLEGIYKSFAVSKIYVRTK